MIRSIDSRIDPVCGMTVAPGDEAAHIEHDGAEYLFCSTSCAEKFRAVVTCYLQKQERGAHDSPRSTRRGRRKDDSFRRQQVVFRDRTSNRIAQSIYSLIHESRCIGSTVLEDHGRGTIGVRHRSILHAIDFPQLLAESDGTRLAGHSLDSVKDGSGIHAFACCGSVIRKKGPDILRERRERDDEHGRNPQHGLGEPKRPWLRGRARRVRLTLSSPEVHRVVREGEKEARGGQGREPVAFEPCRQTACRCAEDEQRERKPAARRRRRLIQDQQLA